MKSLPLFFVLVPLSVHAQKSIAPNQYQQKADSIVAFFLGGEIFQHYVSRDIKKSRPAESSGYYFHYNFRHPKLSGHTFVITFKLDEAGKFLPGEETRGLVRLPKGSDTTWTTAKKALQISRDQSHRIKKRSLRLSWDAANLSYDTFQETNDFRDIIPGEMVWKVDGEVLFRGDRYWGTFEVNVLTGSLTRRFAIPWD